MAAEKKRFYQKGWFLCLWLILLPPVSLVLLWTSHKGMKGALKACLTALFLVISILWFASFTSAADNGPGESADNTPQAVEQSETPVPSKQPEAESRTAAGEAAPIETPAEPAGDEAESTPQNTEIPLPAAGEAQTPAPPEVSTPGTESEPPADPGDTGASPSPSSGSGNGENFNTYDEPSQQQTSANYVLNTNTKKFHYPACGSVKKISPKNYSVSYGTREEVVAQGYSPCGNCKP